MDKGEVMNKEQLAEKYATRINKCLLALKILIISAGVSIAALVIFVVIAGGVNLWESNADGVLLGIVIPGIVASACVTGALAVLIAAKITIKKLKKLGRTDIA